MAQLVRGFNLIYRNFPELGALYCYVSLPVGGKREHVSLWNFHLDHPSEEVQNGQDKKSGFGIMGPTWIHDSLTYTPSQVWAVWGSLMWLGMAGSTTVLHSFQT